MRSSGHVARVREKRNAYRILVGNVKGADREGRDSELVETSVIRSTVMAS